MSGDPAALLDQPFGSFSALIAAWGALLVVAVTEPLAFGVLALSNVMILSTDARSVAIVATQIGGAAAIVVMGGFYEYSSVVLGLDPRQMRPRLTWYLVGLILVAMGAFVSATPLPRLIDLPGPPAPYPRVYITVPGQLYFTATLALALHGVTRLVRAARTHPELVRVVVAWCLTWIFACHDMATRLMGVRSFMLTEVLGVATIGAMTAAVLDRFVNTESALQHRTEELHRSHSELQGIQEQLVHRQQLAAVGELSAVIAHEVRNPIAVIKNAVSGLRRERTREEDRLTFDLQLEVAQRMNFTPRAGRSGVERFMRYYFLMAKIVGDLTGVFLAHLDDQWAVRGRRFMPTLFPPIGAPYWICGAFSSRLCRSGRRRPFCSAIFASWAMSKRRRSWGSPLKPWSRFWRGAGEACGPGWNI